MACGNDGWRYDAPDNNRNNIITATTTTTNNNNNDCKECKECNRGSGGVNAAGGRPREAPAAYQLNVWVVGSTPLQFYGR